MKSTSARTAAGGYVFFQIDDSGSLTVKITDGDYNLGDEAEIDSLDVAAVVKFFTGSPLSAQLADIITSKIKSGPPEFPGKLKVKDV